MNLIHQRYEIVKRLGEGGTSTVLQVHDHRLHMDFAMKRTRSKVDEDKAIFLHEIAVMSKLHHEQIPRIIDQFEEDGYGCVVMELIHGMPLLTYMQKHGTISEPMIMNWIMQILDIFSYLHHLDPLLLYVDLKPQNIMIDDKGMLYLIDFGSSIFHHQTQIKSATPRYAPDDVLKYHNASIQSDIYSIGMTFYVLYHGHFPKERSSHDRLDDVLFHCMEERVEDRYKHVEAIQKALQKIRVSQSHHLPFALVFLSFFLIFLCGGFYFHENEDSSQNEMYFSAMQQKDYEQAVMLRPAQISAYQKRYEEVCGVEDCMKGLLDILHLAKKYHGDESEDVLFLLASRSMLLDTPEGYQIAETYFGILNKKNEQGKLPSHMYELAKLLQKQQLRSDEQKHMAHLLNQTVESTFSLRDMSLRFAYEKMLLKLYSTYHAFADNSNTRILQLCDDMKYLLHQKPDAFSEKEAFFIKEKEALAYYYQGYAAFEKRDYDSMKAAYDRAVGLMEKADMKEQYSLMCDMLITTFEYGISDGEKNMHLDYLHRAVSYAEKIQDAQSRQYFLTILHDDLMIWG